VRSFAVCNGTGVDGVVGDSSWAQVVRQKRGSALGRRARVFLSGAKGGRGRRTEGLSQRGRRRVSIRPKAQGPGRRRAFAAGVDGGAIMAGRAG